MKRTLSFEARLTLGLTVFAAALAALWLGMLRFGTAEPSPSPSGAGLANELALGDPRPIGAEAYDHALSEAAGQPLDGRRLESAARRARVEYEHRLDALATEIATANDAPGKGVDWRGVFARLERDHPPDAQAVLEAYRREIQRQALFLEPLDVYPRPRRPARVAENENPIFRRYFSLAMYLDGVLAVTLDAPGDPPESGSYLVNHCRICIPPLVAHEVAPGHHVAYSVAAEAVPEAPRRLVSNRENVVYHEGWGLYAEHLLLELGYYDSPAAELGAVRLLYLRALRASIDPALHRGEISQGEAVELYREQANLGTEAAEIEVARHLEDPVSKASYFIGLEQILELRRLVLGDRPSIDELGSFHRRFLGRPRPIPEIAREVFGVELPAWAPKEDDHEEVFGSGSQGNSPG